MWMTLEYKDVLWN